MDASWTDEATWIESPPSTMTDMKILSYIWARPVRLVLPTIMLAPNDCHGSIFRSGLVTKGLEYIAFEYYSEPPQMDNN
jgi:hypothetical protein